MYMRDQLFSPVALTPKEQPAVAVISMLYDNLVRSKNKSIGVVKGNKWCVCCANCREQISVDCVAIWCIVLKCWQL